MQTAEITDLYKGTQTKFPYGLVLVEWEDSYGCASNWEDIPQEGEPSAMLCHSIGWITSKSKRVIVLVPHIAQNKDLEIRQGCGDMTIPLVAVRKIKRLKIRF